MARGSKKTEPADGLQDWQRSFQAQTFRLNFVLALTQPMIEFLSAVADGVQWNRAIYNLGNVQRNDWITTERALTKRGLVRRKLRSTTVWKDIPDEDWASMSYNFCELTPAGEAVVNLLKVTGLFIESDAAATKKRG